MPRNILETIAPTILGRRLQEARKARGLTQKEVADALEMSRTTVTALEKGDRRARPDELIQLARLYARSVNSLVSGREPVQDFTVQFRTSFAKAGPQEGRSDLQQAVQEFQALCEDYLHLEHLNRAQPQQNYPAEYPIAGIAPDDAAEDVAASERNRLGLGDGPVLDLRGILDNDVGLRVFYINMPSRLAGIFSYTEEAGGCIAVNARHPEERRRWSLAHEYGHFLTNRFQSELTLLTEFDRVPYAERLADAFARSLLMPGGGLRRRFNQMLRESGGKATAAEVCRIAHYYFVSVEAMMLRLEELRLLPRGAWERLRDRGFKVREAQEQLGLLSHPRDDRLLPIRYQFLAVQAYEEGDLTEGELARLLRTDRVSARRMVQELTHPAHVLDEGEVTPLPIDFASIISRQDS